MTSNDEKVEKIEKVLEEIEQEILHSKTQKDHSDYGKGTEDLIKLIKEILLE